MIQKIINDNRQIYTRYNNFRKQIFSELAPRESETILYWLPWLLSVNFKNCPGYIQDLAQPFLVYNIDKDPEIHRREPAFKRMFGIRSPHSLLVRSAPGFFIQGLYTIGSIGTVSQTSASDCDIWVCYDKREFDRQAWEHLNEKLSIIKGWLDNTIKMSVYFFLCDVSDIRNCDFGAVDSESAGSTQKNVLKEEFYRTCIVIAGKMPLWWICHDPAASRDARQTESETGLTDKDKPPGWIGYEQLIATLEKRVYAESEFIDLGNLERVERSEYFGAALWLLHKSLTRPLKSIIKMTLLKMVLDAAQQRLICHRFREAVLEAGLAGEPFPDPSVFAMGEVFAYHATRGDDERLDFIKKCFYLRCDIKPYAKKQTIKKDLTLRLFQDYPLSIQTRLHLSHFAHWEFETQLELGNRLFKLLLDLYKEITEAHSGTANAVDRKDLSVLGRKIFVTYQKKPDKIAILQKPSGNLNLSALTLWLDGGKWMVFSGTERKKPLIASTDIIRTIVFIVANDIFDAGRLHMEPNPSRVTLQEVINLGRRVREIFGISDVAGIDFSDFVQPERITRMLVVVSFEKSPWEKDINDFAVICKNNWGELFVKRVNSPHKLQAFLRQANSVQGHIETHYYVQRNANSYEKIIERTRRILLPTLHGEIFKG